MVTSANKHQLPQNAGEGKVRLVLAKASRECRVVLPSQKSNQVLNYPELQKEIPKSSDPICLYFFICPKDHQKPGE